MAKTEIAFLFIGGTHHVAHVAPVAAELSRRMPDARVRCLHADPETGKAIAEVARAMEAPALSIEEVAIPASGHWLARITGRKTATKGPLLLRFARMLRQATVIATPERTSAALKTFHLTRAPLLHFRHGAGDRAPKSEKRLKAFDLILVPGEKDTKRAVEAQAIPRERLVEIGYVKLDYLARGAASRPPLFDNDRPVVLYNPHFDPAISSLDAAREVIAAFAAQDRYNLVYAPHIRASDDMPAETMAAWQALAVPGRIMIDLRSPRLTDMTYTLGADIYLGDVSSQFYEFIAQPRPAAFLNTHGVAWEHDLRYANWHLGEVANGPAEMIAAIDRAVAGHDTTAPRQRAAVEYAMGRWQGAIARAAYAVMAAIRR